MRRGVAQKLPVALATAAILVVATARADRMTIATFADPVPNGSPNAYLFELAGDTLSGGWQDLGLDLITPVTGEVYEDATFTMTDLTVDMSGHTTSGTIEFLDDVGVLILQIDFDAGQLYAPFGFGASSLLGHNVTFSGPIITIPYTEEAFAFSFANQNETQDGYTWTAAFTSSGVPEPGTLALLILGGIASGVGRRSG